MHSLRIALLSLFIASSLLLTANGLSCYCPGPEDCPEVQCPEGIAKVWDECACCQECAKAEGEWCSAMWGGNGGCNDGLKCALPLGEDRFHSGVCQDESTVHQCQLDWHGELCGYQGVCKPVGDDDYDCDCDWPGMTGKFCAEVVPDACASQPCQNGGECHSDLGSTEVICLCYPGFEGKFCEVELPDACESHPCQHDSECFSDLGSTEVHCMCTPDFMGQFCETPVPDECESEPCQNGGDCHSEMAPSGTYRFAICMCPPDFMGQFCEISMYRSMKDPCESNQFIMPPCQNDGLCIGELGTDNYVCDCLPDFTGEFCEHSMKDPCKSLRFIMPPCQNNGLCIGELGTNNYVCDCLPGFAGDSCETELEE